MKHRAGALTALFGLLAACAGSGTLNVRPIATGYAPGDQPASARVAEARGHFALGNVALAAEGFRRAIREDPSSVDAMNGLAACYDRMGRFDLSRGLYEKALAVAPGDARLYANLAVSLELQGKSAEAAGVRREAGQRFAASSTAVPLAPPTPVSTPVDTPRPVEERSASVTLHLPKLEADPATAQNGGPRLERIGLGEVALRTGGPVRWTSTAAPQPRTAALSSGGGPRPASVVVLNGTRVTGLAARTRGRLQGLGWQRIAIGNAADPLASSQILFSSDRAREAQRLARQLGLPLRKREWGAGRLVVQLGRDQQSARRAT